MRKSLIRFLYWLAEKLEPEWGGFHDPRPEVKSGVVWDDKAKSYVRVYELPPFEYYEPD